MINPYADQPVYLQLADLLRDQITTGELQPGALLPPEARLAYEHSVGKDSVRSALAVLRSEGLIETRRPAGTRVRQRRLTEVVLELGSTVEFRAATPQERKDSRLPVGAYVAVMTPIEGEPVVYVADLHIFRAL